MTRNGVKNMIDMDGRSPSGFTSSDYTGYNYTPPSPNTNVVINIIFDPTKV